MKKTIIVKRVNDKFLKIMEKIDQSKIKDSIIILIADTLEKNPN